MILLSFINNRYLYLFLVLMTYTNSTAQSSSKNYVQTKAFLDDAGTTFLRHIDYYDELGYVAETVDVGCNTSQTPIIAKTEYTSRLKTALQWAPVPATGLDFLADVMNMARTAHSDTDPYSENWYDDFQDLASSRKPGVAWEDHIVTVNRQVVPANVVRKDSVTSNGSLLDAGTYPYGLLTSTTTIDEDTCSITVYADMDGNTILERRDTDNDTYYVYDNYGRLSYVLPPMCQQCGTSQLSKYWYKYIYDDRGRCIEKHLPGCGAVKYWYDEANRIQSEQDGHLRSQSLYRNYSYDAIGRLLLQTVSATRGEATLSNALRVEAKNYYDNYSFRQEFAQLFPEWADSINATYVSPMVARGRLTATLCYTSNAYGYFEIYRYDSDGRMVYKLSAYKNNWMKIVHTAYNFVGDVTSEEENVYTYSNSHISFLAGRRTVNAFYPGTRLLVNTTVTHTDKNNNTSTQTVSNPTYDVFGNVIADNRPGTAADMTYTHDTLHGWLKGVSSPCGFSEQLQRETATKARYNGNIGRMLWRNTTNGEQHRYDYTYDRLGRLTSSQYSSSANGTAGRFNESVSYNPNSSITSLFRNGMKNDGTFGAIDSLDITYDGNRLLKVTDDAETLNYNGALDFDDGDDSTCEYQYDNNGGLIYDSNRGINSITYDYSHHPITISRTTKMKTIYYDYTPDGRKLSSTHISYIPNGNSNIRILTRDLYVDGLILRGGKPLMWQFGGGYVELNDNGTPTSWNYYVTDHLGSTRMVVDSNDSIKENINYYPFGSEMRLENPALLTGSFSHPFRFTGKELDKLNSLNMYDFGARMYDVAGVPMWTSVDPLAEKYYNVSPYMYCEGNPVNMIDPDGMDYYFSVNGCFIRKDDKETQNVLIGSDDEGYKLLIIDGHAVQYNDFLMYASTVYGESSAYRQKDVDKELEYEMYAIASVFKRNTKAYGKNSDSAKYFRSIGDEERNRDGRMQTAIAATINAMTGGYDYSYGADMWDGAEQGMFGKEVTSAYVKRYELHMNTMGWDISDEHYKKWKTNVGKGFIAPQQRYAVKEYVNRKGKIVKNINAGKKRLKSTAVYGRTIFWNSK